MDFTKENLEAAAKVAQALDGLSIRDAGSVCHYIMNELRDTAIATAANIHLPSLSDNTNRLNDLGDKSPEAVAESIQAAIDRTHPNR